jgi:hypothetical protein
MTNLFIVLGNLFLHFLLLFLKIKASNSTLFYFSRVYKMPLLSFSELKLEIKMSNLSFQKLI